jgi:sterol desaturase/sphingolipid hydroxylase (fatty acid hydroxylase superfamily)
MDTSTLSPAAPGSLSFDNDLQRPRRSLRYWFLTVLIAGAAVVSITFFDRSPLAVLPFLFVLVVPFEKLFPRHRGQKVKRAAVGTDVGYLLASPVLQFIGLLIALPIAVASLAWLPALALRPLVAMIPPAAAPFVAFALFDLLIYWVHRWSHDVPFLWRFHSIHHSTETLDWVSGFRAHPFDGVILAPAFVFLLAAGFSAELTGALAVIQIIFGLFLHANVRWRLRPLHRLIITPEFHHWHHANEPEAISTNHSVFLPIWDMMFGTYYMPSDKRPQRYGVSEPVPAGIAAQLMHPLRGAGNPLRFLLHPIKGIKAAWSASWHLVGELRRATYRRRAVRVI